MKVPEKIKKAIIACAKHNQLANEEEKIIYAFLEKHKLTGETASNATRNIDDRFIDCCKLTNNPELFMKDLEELEE